MRTAALDRFDFVSCVVIFCLLGIWQRTAVAIPSFESIDSRLPNPDRAYEMTSGTVHYSNSQFSMYDLTFQPSNPSQLDIPSLRPDHRYEFDSTFDITYKAVVSFGAEPAHQVTGPGKARAIGVTRTDPPSYDSILPVQVYDTELVSLNLYGLSFIPEFMFRESPTRRSGGVTIREDSCPVCAAPFTRWKISSFFDIATEVSYNTGATWNAASDIIHVEQAPDGFPPGDYNKDHSVDAADYIVWRRTLGRTGAGLAADGDWSGIVDAGDYRVWRANIGHVTTAGGLGGSAVPEPSNVALLLVCLVSLAIHRLLIFRQRNLQRLR
jgi:hypothetical protein